MECRLIFNYHRSVAVRYHELCILSMLWWIGLDTSSSVTSDSSTQGCSIFFIHHEDQYEIVNMLIIHLPSIYHKHAGEYTHPMDPILTMYT